MKKICSKCGVEKEITEFSKDKTKSSGRKSQCKECSKKYRMANRNYFKEYRENNKEKIKEYRKANKEKISKYNKEYKKANEEKMKEYQKEYYKEYRKINKGKIKEYQKEYHKEYCKTQKGKEYLKLNQHKRRARKKAVDQLGTYTIKEWTSCLEFFNNCDAYTGEPLNGDISIDHIIPIKAGGTNNINNLVPCKKAINSSKNAQDWLEWYRKQPFYSKRRENKINKWILINSQISFLEIS